MPETQKDDEEVIEEVEEPEEDLEEQETEEDVEDAEESEEDLQHEISVLRAKLRRANAESAQRRIKLKELRDQISEDTDESEGVEELRRELQESRQALVEYKLKDMCVSAAAQLKYDFVTPLALTDAQALVVERVLNELGDLELEDENDVKPLVLNALKEVTKTRPYLIKKRKAPDISGGARQKDGGALISDEEESELAVQFGIRR